MLCYLPLSLIVVSWLLYYIENMEDLDLSDYKVTSEVHVFSEGESQDDANTGRILKHYHYFIFDSSNLLWILFSNIKFQV